MRTLTLLALPAALCLTVACGGVVTKDDTESTSDTEPSSSEDTEDTEDETDTEPEDTEDTEPVDTEDTEPVDTDDTEPAVDPNDWTSAIGDEAWLLTDDTPAIFGISSSATGDLDGDGNPDLLVASVREQFVFYGPFTGDRSTADANIAEDVWASHVGDLDGDGQDDVLLSWFHELWLVPGPVSGDLSNDDASALITHGSEPSWGRAPKAADLDGDGFAELVVSTIDSEGAIHVFTGPITADLEAPMDASAQIIGGSGEYFAIQTALTPDVDGDGLVDLVVGIPGARSGGAVGVLTGPPADYPSDSSDIDQRYTGAVSDDQVGSLVLPAGDVDGDGYGDVFACDDACLSAWVLDGSLTGGSTAAAATVAQLRSPYPVSGGSQDNAAVLDFDGDGELDVAISNPSHSGDDGTVWIAFGPLSGTLDITSRAEIYGADEKLGYSMSSADLDGDGYDDLLIAAPYNDTEATDGGGLYLLYGRDF